MRKILAVCVALLALPGAHALETWPNGARAAVSLAYDDALDSQLDHALPALDRHGVKATFYLTLANPPVQRRLAAWRAAAQGGHELGNHTLFHQCSGKGPGREWVAAQRDLDSTSVAHMLDQARVANAMLHAIDGRRERTFNAPCGDALAGGQPYWPALRDEFVALRPAGPATAGLSGAQLVALVKEQGAQGGVVNLVFHGIGGDYLSVSKEAHEELLAFLAAHRKEYWSATYLDIVRHQRGAKAGWVLDWADEFEGDALDVRKWVPEVAGHGFGNNEMQFYTARRENVRVEGGNLVIEARQEDWQGRRYTSARLKTAGLVERQYGRFEARIKLPRGQGIWPAFWMLGADIDRVGWPRSGEIDIMENIGKEPGIVHGTVHGPGYAGEKAFGAPSALAPGQRYADGFHVFAVEWEPGEIRWYRDGRHYHTARPATVRGEWVFEHPFFLLLNLAVGGYWPGYPDAATRFPQQMLVDYVRIYQTVQ
ncbi:family 16 glycosylhydrolase [Pseudoduganella sp. DS3]|uniref:Family 16 glycosylhydrolase n=1 Tax=Pseudoduganella guangdongensis TaxID=2692179 RepID=A0A6N9HNM3_9BURK|nr:family 16 glycosylhydrolase [Pseudoduganella guangdongensis]MYN05278.1 family 16 glycosylhydrolase [Pseudoduganella guangdongensis]